MDLPNSYRPAAATKRSAASPPTENGSVQIVRLPVSIRIMAVFDLIVGTGFGIVFLGMLVGEGSVYDWVTALFTVTLPLIACSLIATAAGLLSNHSIGWWLAVFSHCLLALFVLLVFAGIADLIDSWGVLRKGSDPEPASLTVVTAIFLLAESFALFPIFLLCRKSVRQLYL